MKFGYCSLSFRFFFSSAFPFQRNHLVGVQLTVLKLSFHTVSDLLKVRRFVQPAVRKNRERAAQTAKSVGEVVDEDFGVNTNGAKTVVDQTENMFDMR